MNCKHSHCTNQAHPDKPMSLYGICVPCFNRAQGAADRARDARNFGGDGGELAKVARRTPMGGGTMITYHYDPEDERFTG